LIGLNLKKNDLRYSQDRKKISRGPRIGLRIQGKKKKGGSVNWVRIGIKNEAKARRGTLGSVIK